MWRNRRIQWIVVADGHGQGKVINLLRSLDWGNIIENETYPFGYVRDQISLMNNTLHDGCTLSIVKITPSYIHCTWIGDSQIRAYEDGREIWRSKNHNFENQDEINNVKKTNMKLLPAWHLSVIDEDTITMKPTHYIEYAPHAKNAMSRCLGHDNLIYPNEDTYTISHDNNKMKIIVASDGFWDMISPSDITLLASPYYDAKKLTNIAVTRWNQEWIYLHPGDKGTHTIETIQTQMDDICVGVWIS